jgi:hypothetical protein
MDSKKISSHNCKNKEIICPEPGCGCSLRVRQLRRHLDEDCLVSLKRKNIIQQAALKKQREEEEREAKKLEAKIKLETEKIIETEKIKQQKLQQQRLFELQEDDENYDSSLKSPTEKSVEENKIDENVKNETKNVFCGDCNEPMKESQLAVHLRERCFKRKILCPNRFCGCTGSICYLFSIDLDN